MNIKQLLHDGKIDNYQDILLPNETIKGFRDSLKTWEVISRYINFENKTVLDIGCSHGFFLIKSVFNKARKAYGIDKNGFHNCEERPSFVKPLDLAGEIIKEWKIDNIELIEGDWVDYNFDKKVDIVLCLNTLHYFKDLMEGLKKIFYASNEWVVFETGHIFLVEKLANSFGFEIDNIVDSHWNFRKIMFLKKKSVLNQTVKPYKIRVVDEAKTKQQPMNFLGRILNKMLEGYDSVLDIGCAEGRTFNPTSGIYVGIDANNRILNYKPTTTNFLMKYDFSNGLIPFLDKNFDVVLLMDVIEHLEKDKAIILLKEAERIAKEKVIVYTPDGFLEQDEKYVGAKTDPNFDKYDFHRCGFDRQEMENIGYEIEVYPGDNAHNRGYTALLGVKDVGGNLK